jgi:hypothetical protein
MVFANQLVLGTGEAFFYAEVGQPSQVELSFSRGQENEIGFCHTLFELNNRTPDKPYRH